MATPINIPEASNDTEGLQIPQFIVRAMTAEEEWERICWTVGQMDFYNANGYQIILPVGFESQSLTSSQQSLFLSSMYQPDDYLKAINRFEGARDRIESVFPMFRVLESNWGFKVFNQYELLVTQYGVGGSYHPSTSQIVTRASKDGMLARADAAQTPVHEMVHMGIQHNIVNEFALEHWEKERVVDLMCLVLFGDRLPHYTLQIQGINAVNQYLSPHNILHRLPEAIEEYAHSKSKQSTRLQ